MSDDLAIGEERAHRVPLPLANSSRVVRIFISSPGDVAEERDQARRVIEGLQRQYPGLTLRPVLWEELALPATATFQEGIEYVLNKQPIDIAVFVLWSRLGTPLGPAITRPTGEPYRSGTERELDLMLTAFEQSGHKHPLILAYARDDDASFKRRLVEAPKSALEELVDQQKLAEQFIREHFQDAQGHNLRAYHSYREPVGFAQRLRAHLREALDDLLGTGAAPRWLEEPYRALQVFDVAHAPIFHGRDEETCDVLQRLRDQRRAGCEFVVIVGASGSGKSSLARAGVAASLVQSSVDDGARQWRAAIFVPALETDDLLARLAHVLAAAIPGFDASPSMLNDLAAGLKQDAPLAVRLSLNPAFARAAEQLGGPVRVLLVLDPLEELWTDRRIAPADRELFFQAITALAASGHVSVLATLRSDFYPQAQQQLARLKGERGHYDLFAPDPAALARLIREPARLAGLTFERQEHTGRTLDEIILQDAVSDSSARDTTTLPLLEYALSELYRRRDEQRRLLTLGAYQAMGGVEGALANRAEAVFNSESLPETARAALAEILPLLITVDTDGDQAAVRRRAWQADLTSTPARQALFQALTAARFLTTDREGDRPVASLAHEALLRRWKRIGDWITTNREHLRLRARVEQAERRWEQQSRDDLLLPPGLPLEEARQLLHGAPQLLAAGTADYIRASIASDERRKQQSRRRRRIATSVLSILTLLATCAALIAWNKQREADEQRALAEEQREQADQQRAEADQQRALAEGQRAVAEQQRALADAQRALTNEQRELADANAHDARQQRDHAVAAEARAKAANEHLTEQLRRAAASIIEWGITENQSGRPDRALALFASARATAPRGDSLRDSAASLVAGSRARAPAGLRHNSPVLAVAFSPGGRTLATACEAAVLLWDVASGKEIRKLEGHSGRVFAVAFSADGQTLATGSWDKTARLWDVASGKEIRKLEGRGWPVHAVAFSPDGRALATGSHDGTARIWDIASGKETRTFTGNNSPASVVFSPDGRSLVTAGGDKTARLWDVATGKEVRTFNDHDDVYAVAFGPNGRTLATGGLGKIARLWDVASGKEVRKFKGHGDSVYAVAFSPDGRMLATGSGDKSMRLWNASNGKEIGKFEGHDNLVSDTVFSPDGRTLATAASRDKTARLWDLASGTEIRKFEGRDDHVHDVAFSPDGRMLAAGVGQTVPLWDVASGVEIRTLKGHSDWVLGVVFSPDGRTLATASMDKTVRLWNVARGDEIGRLEGHSGPVEGLAFSPDGGALATGSMDKTARLWDVASGRETRTFRGHGDWVHAVAFSPDGRALATGSHDGTAPLWDVASGKEIRKFEGGLSINSLAFSPDGHTLATGCFDQTARLWDVTSGKETRKFVGGDLAISAMEFSADGRTLATGSDDGTARLWDVASGREIRLLARHTNSVTAVAFSPEGQTLATALYDSAVRLWELPVGVPDKLLGDYVAVHSGWLVDNTGVLRELSATEWEARRKSLEEHGGEWLAGEAKRYEQRTVWFHQLEADEAERDKSWFAAAFHLRKLLERSPDDAELRARYERAQANAREAAANPPAPPPAAPSMPDR